MENSKHLQMVGKGFAIRSTGSHTHELVSIFCLGGKNRSPDPKIMTKKGSLIGLHPLMAFS
jgi:hypothetical protein